MPGEFGVESSLQMLAGEFESMGVYANLQAANLARMFGALAVQRVRMHAMGRPGPEVQTGNYLASIQWTTEGFGTGIAGVDVGSDADYSMRLEFGFVGVDSLGRHYCVDMDTEILTTRGWQKYLDLVEGEMVMTLNPKTWLMEWQPLLAVNVFEGPYEAVVIQGRTLSAITTADHRWLVERYYGRERRWIREWKTTSTMTANVRIPLVQPCASLPSLPTLDDDLVELAGWFWTEGSYDWSRSYNPSRTRTNRPISLRISQSTRVKQKNVDRIADLLTRMFGQPDYFVKGGHWWVSKPNSVGVVVFKLDRVACWLLEEIIDPPHKVLKPSFLLKLTQHQLDLLIETSMAADGHTDAGGVSRLGQSNLDRIRSWEMACILAGHPIVTRWHPNKQLNHSRLWNTTLLRTSFSHVFGSALRLDRNNCELKKVVLDRVWCPMTVHGTWLARREGTVYFTGNSQPPYAHFGPAMDELEPLWEEMMAGLADLDAFERGGYGGGASLQSSSLSVATPTE